MEAFRDVSQRIRYFIIRISELDMLDENDSLDEVGKKKM